MNSHYEQAVLLMDKGATVDELVQTCGLSKGEAELMSPDKTTSHFNNHQARLDCAKQKTGLPPSRASKQTQNRRGGRVAEGARLGKCVYGNPVSRVRIPLSPPLLLQSRSAKAKSIRCYLYLSLTGPPRWYTMDKDMYNQSRLLNRNNTYYYRAKIPADLQSHFGKKERKFSLRTKDRAKAAALVRKFSVEEDEEFSRLRALKNKEFQTVTTIDNAFIQEICKRYHHAVLHGDENLRKDKETRDILEVHMGNRTGLMSDLRTALAYGDADKIKPALSVFLLLNKIILDCSEADYEDLSYEFLKALTQTHGKTA